MALASWTDNGVIVSIGMLVNLDRVELVMPMVWSDGTSTPSPTRLDADLAQQYIGYQTVKTIETWVDADFLPLIAEDVSVIHISAEPMLDKRTPYRIDYIVGDKLGGDTGESMPASDGAKIDFYFPAEAYGDKTHPSHNTMPGLSEETVDSGVLKTEERENIQTAFGFLIELEGISPFDVEGPLSGFNSFSLYRANKSLRTDDTLIYVPHTCLVRGRLGNVRKREYPQ